MPKITSGIKARRLEHRLWRDSLLTPTRLFDGRSIKVYVNARFIDLRTSPPEDVRREYLDGKLSEAVDDGMAMNWAWEQLRRRGWYRADQRFEFASDWGRAVHGAAERRAKEIAVREQLWNEDVENYRRLCRAAKFLARLADIEGANVDARLRVELKWQRTVAATACALTLLGGAPGARRVRLRPPEQEAALVLGTELLNKSGVMTCWDVAKAMFDKANELDATALLKGAVGCRVAATPPPQSSDVRTHVNNLIRYAEESIRSGVTRGDYLAAATDPQAPVAHHFEAVAAWAYAFTMRYHPDSGESLREKWEAERDAREAQENAAFQEQFAEDMREQARLACRNLTSPILMKHKKTGHYYPMVFSCRSPDCPGCLARSKESWKERAQAAIFRSSLDTKAGGFYLAECDATGWKRLHRRICPDAKDLQRKLDKTPSAAGHYGRYLCVRHGDTRRVITTFPGVVGATPLTLGEAVTQARQLIDGIPLGQRYGATFSAEWEVPLEEKEKDEESKYERIAKCEPPPDNPGANSHEMLENIKSICTTFDVRYEEVHSTRKHMIRKLMIVNPFHLDGERRQTFLDSVQYGTVLPRPLVTTVMGEDCSPDFCIRRIMDGSDAPCQDVDREQITNRGEGIGSFLPTSAGTPPASVDSRAGP